MTHVVNGEPNLTPDHIQFSVQRRDGKVYIPPLPVGAILTDKEGDAFGRYLVFDNKDEAPETTVEADAGTDDGDHAGTDQVKAYNTPEAAPGA